MTSPFCPPVVTPHVSVRRLLGNRPNTYTYTKALAESLLVSECEDMPLAIVRPSIGEFHSPVGGYLATRGVIPPSVMCVHIYPCVLRRIAFMIPIYSHAIHA